MVQGEGSCWKCALMAGSTDKLTLSGCLARRGASHRKSAKACPACPACLSRGKAYTSYPMSCSFPGKDEPNARSLVQPRARRGSCPRKKSPLPRNVVILIATVQRVISRRCPGRREEKKQQHSPLSGESGLGGDPGSAVYAFESLTLSGNDPRRPLTSHLALLAPLQLPHQPPSLPVLSGHM